jgi:SAM-dependent methyltransferase
VTTVLWQLEHDSARSYQDVLVPLLMGPAAGRVVERAGLTVGGSVLDVGCGPGVAAAAAIPLTSTGGRVVAADVNRHLLDLGRAETPGVQFWEADARALPFPDHSFDAVLCTHVLQFVRQPERATAELARVVRAGGTVAVSTWAAAGRQPYLSALAESVARHLGPQAAEPLVAATRLGDPEQVTGLLTRAGLHDVSASEDELAAAVDDLAAFIPRHLAATPVAPVAARATDATIRALAGDVIEALGAVTGRALNLSFVQLVATGTG